MSLVKLEFRRSISPMILDGMLWLHFRSPHAKSLIDEMITNNYDATHLGM